MSESGSFCQNPGQDCRRQLLQSLIEPRFSASTPVALGVPDEVGQSPPVARRKLSKADGCWMVSPFRALRTLRTEQNMNIVGERKCKAPFPLSHRNKPVPGADSCTAARTPAVIRHSITSSASASSFAGISRPSAFAVLKLITSSNLVGCTTGRSAGFSPLRMRPA
jgi:hypothetical protein